MASIPLNKHHLFNVINVIQGNQTVNVVNQEKTFSPSTATDVNESGSYDYDKTPTEEYVKKVAKYLNRPVEFLHCLDKGKVVVINNVDFSDARRHNIELSDRRGSEKDVERIRNFFQVKLGWDVEVPDGKTTIKNTVKYAAATNYDDYESFFLFILSHGCKDGIYETDGSIVNTDNILQHFDANKCPSLNDKPKVFIFQACRGDVNDSGYPTTNDAISQCHLRKRRVPNMNNFLSLYPCARGYTAVRNEGDGTLFIAVLVRLLEECYDREPLHDICTSRVNYAIVNYHDDSGKKMTPTSEISLLKQCYFRKFFVNICNRLKLT